MIDATDMTTPVTRGELRAEIAQLATKHDLEIWGGALLERLMTELARHTKAIQEALSTHVSAIDDKYKDLPGRVGQLEATLLPPARR